MSLLTEINEARDFINGKIVGKNPEIGLILGSGLGVMSEAIKNATHIPYEQIPGFINSCAKGHANELVIGKLCGKNVVAMKGRFHYYEGFSLRQVTFPVRVMKALGVKTLIITNACGAVNTEFNPGDLMVIEDHLNLVADNPLIGKNDENLGVRFLDLSNVYDRALRKLVLNIANEQKIKIRTGVYAYWTGPAYETPAEVRMIRTLGADAVGMSTVPEAIVAVHSGLKVIGISCLTNMACGILPDPLSHNEVIEVAAKVREKFVKLIKGIISQL